MQIVIPQAWGPASPRSLSAFPLGSRLKASCRGGPRLWVVWRAVQDERRHAPPRSGPARGRQPNLVSGLRLGLRCSAGDHRFAMTVPLQGQLGNGTDSWTTSLPSPAFPGRHTGARTESVPLQQLLCKTGPGWPTRAPSHQGFRVQAPDSRIRCHAPVCLGGHAAAQRPRAGFSRCRFTPRGPSWTGWCWARPLSPSHSLPLPRRALGKWTTVGCGEPTEHCPLATPQAGDATAWASFFSTRG